MLKKLLNRFGCSIVIILWMQNVCSQPAFELSQNVYRLPYENGQDFRVNHDQLTHTPPGRFDLKASGADDCNSHRVVAAAAGIVRMKVESHDTSCTGCGSYNNYVWIEHANNEWTKYTHFRKNSVVVNVNDTVCAGDFLGYECWVGSTAPAYARHLHFEVRRPNNPANPVIDTAGGFMNPGDGAHLIPVINTVAVHFMEQGENLTGSGSTSCTSANYILASQSVSPGIIKIYMASGTIRTNSSSITFENASNGLFHAGSEVTLSPGFHIQAGSSFQARIGNCATTVSPWGCN
jgi:hypothetical protein